MWDIVGVGFARTLRKPETLVAHNGEKFVAVAAASVT